MDSGPTLPLRQNPREPTATTALQDPTKERSPGMSRKTKVSPSSLARGKTQEGTSHLVLSIRGGRWRDDILVTWAQASAADENNEETYLHCCQSKESHQNGAKQLQN